MKEQLRTLEDLQPMAELRRKACASWNVDEGLTAFAERHPPVFEGR
ncbi:hypothetical protein ACMSI6_04400 [Pseudomonas antarctica]|nr:hypothetical protein [Pseudomonas antarctica]